MVVSRSDSKRRKKEEVDSIRESPKRTKVHAQRKFAQGSHLNSPVLTPVKDKDKTKYNGTAPTAELLPIKRPKTEQFVNFLVFRGSNMLPKSLEFFNEPSIPEPLAGEEESKRDGPSTSGGSSRAGHRTSDKHGDQAGGVAKAEARNKNRSKSTAAVQALKKKYQEQRMNKEKRSLTKLALKVKGKNMMRTRSAGPLEEKPAAAAAALQKKPVRTTRLVTAVKPKVGSATRKPVLRKPPQAAVVKRVPSKSSVTRGGLRSGGGLPPGSDHGLKTERKAKKVIKMKPVSLKKSVKKPAIASSLSDFSSDDDQPLVKKQRVVSKASILASRVTTRSRLMTKPSTSQITSSRPPRKTKEAATLFMEMLKKDLRSPDEEEDNADAMSVDSFVETPKRTERRGSKDSIDNIKSEKKALIKPGKKETKPNESKLPINKNRKLPDQPVSRLSSLKTRTLRRNSYILVSKEIELKRLKSNRAKLISRMSSRSSSKEMPRDNSNEEDKIVSKGPISERDNRRERRSSTNPIKSPESKVKQQKIVTKDIESSKKSSKKKVPETNFDDSDEEPLGKKVNQITTASVAKVVKKPKPTNEKEDADETNVLEQKLTRRRSVNALHDSSKEDLKQTAQTTVKAQQVSKITSSSVTENRGKGKSETTNKAKICDNDTATPNTKSKQVTGSANETSTSIIQKPKETDKSTIKNKTQTEKKVSKSTVKDSENEKKLKSQENSHITLEKEKQEVKNMKKSDPKKSSGAKGNEADLNFTSKEVGKVAKQKNSTDNFSKTDIGSAVQISKDNSEKNNTLDKITSRKNANPLDKEVATSKSKNDSVSVSTISEKTVIDRESCADIESPESNNIVPSKERSLDSKISVHIKNNNKPALDSGTITLLTKSNKTDSEERISVSSTNLGTKKKKQPTSKINALNNLSCSDSPQTTKREIPDEQIAQKDVDEKNKMLFKGKSGDVDSNNTSPKGWSSTDVICQQTILTNNTEELAKDNRSCSVISKDITLKVESQNSGHKQIPSSSSQIISNEKSQESREVIPRAPNHDGTSSKITKYNVVDKSNDKNSSTNSSKLVNIMKDVAEDITKMSNSGNSSNILASTESPQIVNSQPCHIDSCNKSLSSIENELILTSKTISGTSIVSSVKNSSNFMPENGNLGPKNIPMSKDTHPLQVTPTKQQPTTQSINTSLDEKHKHKCVVSEPISKNFTLEGKPLPPSPALLPSDFKGKISEHVITTTGQTHDFKTDDKKIAIKEEKFVDTSSKLGSQIKSDVLDMSDKVSSAVETLMSLKNVQKIDEKSFTIQTGGWNIKSGPTFDVEHKRAHEPDFKRLTESEPKHVDTQDCKKIKVKEGEVKRVTIQEPEFKRFHAVETDVKRSNPHESDFRRFHIQDHKPRPEHPQVLKGCSNPKSMLKPGTLIDIAGISHSPEIMTPLRPGVDGEIIPMNRPIRPIGQEIVDPFKVSAQGFKPYDPRIEPSTYGYRWQSSNSEKNVKPELLLEKDASDSKSKTPVNESAWRQAFKNVKDPKSINNAPSEKPVVKKQLSVTALAKKHKSKSEIVTEKNMLPQTSASIPFLRHNKPFLGPSPTKTKDAGSSGTDVKKSISNDVDPASLREKEAEVEEFLRQCGEYSRSLAPAITPVNSSTAVRGTEISSIGSIKAPYLPSHGDSSNIQENSASPSEPVLSHVPDVKCPTKQLPSHEQSETGLLFASDSARRANSPLKYEKRQISTELSPYGKSSLTGSTIPQPEQPIIKQTSLSSSKQDQTINIFQIDSVRRSNSPKSFTQKSAFTTTDLKSKFDDSSFPTSSPVSQTVQQVVTANLLVGTQPTNTPAKLPLPDKSRHFSPNRSSQNVVTDNLFKDSNLTKRTKSPTIFDSYPYQSSSPRGNSINRNTNSPVFGKCSTPNIFKEIVPAKRSYSPTFPQTSQNEGETVPNLFTQNPNFRRSVSPLSNRTGFSKLGTSKDSKDCNSETTKKTDVIEQKKVESCLQDGPKTFRDGKAYVTSTISSVVEQKPMSPTSTQNTVPVDIQQLQSSQSVVGESLVVKEEAVELKGTRNQGDFIACENTLKPDQPEKPSLPSQEIESEVQGSNISLNTPGMSEAKHRLPLAVEQTLKKLGQTRSPQNKKPTLPQKVKFSEQNVKNIQSQIEGAAGPVEASTGGVNWRGSQSPFVPKLTTGIYSHNQEEELDLMQKKKVNMSAEEIKRWLNDSSTSEIEHRVNCGILENNTCECEYRNTLTPNLQSIDLPTKFETTSKSETTCVDNSDSNQFSAIDTPKKTISSQINSSVPEIFEAKHSFTAKEKDVLRDIKKEESVKPEAVLVSKHEPAKSVSSDKNSNSNQLKDEGLVSIKNFCVPVPVGGSENIKQPPTTPPLSKLRTFRLPNKNPDVEPKPNSTDIIEVCPPARDDASSSNDLSSSNEETPEKSHSERKSIFHQRRSTLKVKERRELLAPSVNAFSPENESSVYAFDPELPPTSTPFRRSKGKDGKSTCTTTDDEDLTPSSNSIAVQVNFDNEAVLECSTQTDVQEGDDDDTHTFYIPLQQSAADTNKPPLIQGVAVKVDTEGPDQKVIMRAKLVTKPLSTFSQSSSSPRGLIGTRSGKPEQKVRPLSVKPPVGTVQPTARPKPKPVTAQEDLPGPSKATPTCSPQAARLAKRIKSKAAVPSTSAENHPPKVPPAKLVEAPTFYPTEKEFEDPLEYISSITPQAEKYGLCRVVPPSNFKPECKVSDDMRFTAYNQYIHKMLHRWGPNVKEMLAIKKYLATQSIALTHPPWIGGMEVDLPRLYQTVQQCGGLKEVIEKKRWHRVADLMKIPKSAQDRVTKLDDIYCKFLLPYDTLSHVERTQLFEGVERDWIEREKRVANQQESSATDEDDESDSDSDSDIDECIVKGRSMALSGFYRIARNTMSMWFPKTDTPSAADVELEFWKHVASRQHHVCVHSGSIDSGAMGYGFPTGKNSSTSRHPWNLKMLTNNPGSILRFLGPLMGVTVPTLHVGMLFSACCWYRDPHGLPWIEYLHTGASKIWYGIPDSSSNQFRDAVMSIVPRLCRDKTLWLASDTAMVPPPLLVEKGVSLSRIVQDPGQFIIVFPKAFTSSICTGYLVSESVYFAQPSWLSTAQALFNDMRESSEPTVFSLEKLLFSIVNDSRSNADVLNQILSIVVSLRDGEIAGRRQLEELGLNTTERLSSRRKGKARPAGDGEEDLECDECRMTLYISWMSNSQDSSVYCLPHAVELLSNKRSLVKHCTLVYAFSEDELEELVEKLKSRVENKNQKKSVSKSGKS